ncbi:cupin domain-containing protein [Tenggerimyces flavus]|uniref:Cupin domain-containing protein n=1 Tax=Tenggerimyces flavus TaxID=1708749 RepID=A0ABV7YFG8_9ACTN|nr:cupin domain-containing protein [Tenggerimyces flavus]MBM7786869.1 quercetin dioxygenase-like cupin family protein [Tenggerimyces flavus]
MKLRKILVVLAAAPALVGVPAAVSATPGSGVTGVILAQGESDEGIVIRGRGTTDVVVREITIQPGGSTGWHYHDGQLIAVVKQGTLTRTMDDCSTEVTPAGESFVEPRGRNHVHIGRNLGTEPVILMVTYVLPDGKPLSQDAPKPPNCTSS